ncbi:MAG: MCE family protein [Deltaproteobacteria bacterium]|nr:MAG: MCE family protein [Deltaproteobacteria bacterium]
MTQPSNPETTQAHDLPVAHTKPKRRRVWSAWLLPLAALALTGWMLYTHQKQQGQVIEINFSHAYGLKPGNSLKYRGMTVGEVESLVLTKNLSRVKALVRLRPGNEGLARSGSRFWIVHPQVDLSGIKGLETVIGARYIAVQPGKSDKQRWRTRFQGMEGPRKDTNAKPGELDIVLRTNNISGVRLGTPLSYRGINIGSVQSIHLAATGQMVEIYARVKKPFTDLLRTNTEFWVKAPINVEKGILLSGFRIGMSAKTLLFGDIALAIPTKKGKPVRNGHSYVLNQKPSEADWAKDWKPLLRVGLQFLPKEATPPCQVQARLLWTQRRFLRSDLKKARTGWLTLMGNQLWGPANLFNLAKKYDGQLEVAGHRFALNRIKVLLTGHKQLRAIRPTSVNTLKPLLDWMLKQERRGCQALRVKKIQPEKSVLVVGSGLQQPISNTQMKKQKDTLTLNDSVPLGSAFHGAAALSRKTGRLIGLVVIEDETRTIYPIRNAPKPSTAPSKPPQKR